MDVASFELSEELFELSGWKGGRSECGTWRDPVPFYDLGYLMRKLPAGCYVVQQSDEETNDPQKPQWAALGYRDKGIFADIPEDAAAELAIELFRQGVLTKAA